MFLFSPRPPATAFLYSPHRFLMRSLLNYFRTSTIQVCRTRVNKLTHNLPWNFPRIALSQPEMSTGYFEKMFVLDSRFKIQDSRFFYSRIVRPKILDYQIRIRLDSIIIILKNQRRWEFFKHWNGDKIFSTWATSSPLPGWKILDYHLRLGNG